MNKALHKHGKKVIILVLLLILIASFNDLSAFTSGFIEGFNEATG